MLIQVRYHPRDLTAALALATLAVAATAFAADRAPSRPFTAAAGDQVTCSTPIQHPIAVHITALDPVRHGSLVRLRVDAGAIRGFERGDVHLTSSGGTAVVGSRNATLRAVPAGGHASVDFAVAVPREGRRFLIQFQVRTEGGAGSLARGATFNLMPDGPVEQSRAATSSAGAKLIEVQARRIGS